MEIAVISKTTSFLPVITWQGKVHKAHKVCQDPCHLVLHGSAINFDQNVIKLVGVIYLV